MSLVRGSAARQANISVICHPVLDMYYKHKGPDLHSLRRCAQHSTFCHTMPCLLVQSAIWGPKAVMVQQQCHAYTSALYPIPPRLAHCFKALNDIGQLICKSVASNWVCGLQADLVIFPFVDRFALCASKHASYNVSAAGDGAIGAWLKAMSARPSCKVSCASSEKLLQAYR